MASDFVDRLQIVGEDIVDGELVYVADLLSSDPSDDSDDSASSGSASRTESSSSSSSSSSASSSEETPVGETCAEEAESAKTGEGGSGCPAETGASLAPSCPICFEPWTSEGPHRVCCIPCGHVYGRSCLERWVLRCGNNAGKCPTCKRRIKQREIVNLYAPLIAIQNDELDKEVRTLRHKNEQLQSEKAQLVAELTGYRKRQMDRDYSDRQKMTCIDDTLRGRTQRKFGYCDGSFSQTFLENSFPSQSYCSGGYDSRSLVLQNELVVEGARVMSIDASSQIMLVSAKKPGASRDHVLNKISLLAPRDIHKIMFPPNTGPIRDMCTLPNGRVTLFASSGKKLSLFSMETNNFVLKYDLPAPAWSCSGDCSNQYHIYAGLQNGMLLVFDIRQTATHLDAMGGLSTRPIHTVHSRFCNDNTKEILTASSLGPCVWDVDGSGGRQCLLPGSEKHGVCIALACSSSTGDIVATFRPKVEVQATDILSSPFPASATNSHSGLSKVGSHVLFRRTNETSSQIPEVAYCGVPEARMSKSVIISSEGNNPLFVYGDESTHGLCLWDMHSFRVYKRLKPHQHPILDLKYARSAGPGVLGCVSEDRLQIFTCF